MGDTVFLFTHISHFFLAVFLKFKSTISSHSGKSKKLTITDSCRKQHTFSIRLLAAIITYIGAFSLNMFNRLTNTYYGILKQALSNHKIRRAIHYTSHKIKIL